MARGQWGKRIQLLDKAKEKVDMEPYLITEWENGLKRKRPRPRDILRFCHFILLSMTAYSSVSCLECVSFPATKYERVSSLFLSYPAGQGEKNIYASQGRNFSSLSFSLLDRKIPRYCEHQTGKLPRAKLDFNKHPEWPGIVLIQ